jgi:phosphate transport system permease protein
MLVELVTNRNSLKNIKMSTENKLANKEEARKLPWDFTATSYAIVGILFVILAFIVTSIGVISWEFISAMPKME